MHTHSLMRRSLTDSRQILGLVPTLWFWNDRATQRLLLPLTLLISLPLGALLGLAGAALGASTGWWVAVCLVHPFVMMGIVERRIRAALSAREPPQGHEAHHQRAAGERPA